MPRTKLLFRSGIVALIVVVLAGAVAFLNYINSPSVASTITSTSPKVTVQKLNTKPIAVSGSYAKFAYPTFLKPQKQPTVSGSTVAAYSYEYPATEAWELTITVNVLVAGSKDSDSGYYARLENPTKYKESTSITNSQPVVFMTDTRSPGYSKVAFLFHNGYSADIALSSDATQDQALLNQTLNHVVSSWVWK